MIAFLAVCLYNYRKLQDMRKDKPASVAEAPQPAETIPLLQPK